MRWISSSLFQHDVQIVLSQSRIRFPSAGSGPPPTAALHCLASPSAASSVDRTPSLYSPAASVIILDDGGNAAEQKTQKTC